MIRGQKPDMMMRILLLGVLLTASPQALAQEAFVPTEAERATISGCIARTSSEPELKQMSACIGLVAGPCDKIGGMIDPARTPTLFHSSPVIDASRPSVTSISMPGTARCKTGSKTMRLPPVLSRRRNETGSPSATPNAPIGPSVMKVGTIASVMTGDCMRVETGRRALEMRAIFDDLDQ